MCHACCQHLKDVFDRNPPSPDDRSGFQVMRSSRESSTAKLNLHHVYHYLTRDRADAG